MKGLSLVLCACPCGRLCRSSQVPLLPWLLPSAHKMLKINAKWNFPAAWEKRVFCSLCTYIQLAHSWCALRSWVEYRCHAQISRWAGGEEQLYGLKAAREVKSLSSMTLSPLCASEQIKSLLRVLVSSTGKGKEHPRSILTLWVCICFLILSLKHFCVADPTPTSTVWALAADHGCL